MIALLFTFNVSAQPEIEMVFVEGGKFMMGSNEGEEFNKPAHEVSVKSFNIGKYEITQMQWRTVMGYNPSYFSNCDDCPVETISWKDIQKLIKVDVKIISEHPYPWHGGAEVEAAPVKNSNRSGGAHKSRKSAASKQNKKRWY